MAQGVGIFKGDGTCSTDEPFNLVSGNPAVTGELGRGELFGEYELIQQYGAGMARRATEKADVLLYAKDRATSHARCFKSAPEPKRMDLARASKLPSPDLVLIGLR